MSEAIDFEEVRCRGDVTFAITYRVKNAPIVRDGPDRPPFRPTRAYFQFEGAAGEATQVRIVIAGPYAGPEPRYTGRLQLQLHRTFKVPGSEPRGLPEQLHPVMEAARLAYNSALRDLPQPVPALV